MTPHNQPVSRVQRWREGRDSYRPAGEPIETRRYEVAEIRGDSEARAFVELHHYSRSYPAARFRFGLYRGAELAGVAVFSVPAREAALACLPGERLERVELGRFVLLDDVEANGETWFLARAFDELRARGLRGVVSFSDPHPRRSLDGRVVFPGHVGTIYQAHNAVFLGRSKPRALRLWADGTALHPRAVAKLLSRDRGWRYVVDRLVEHGAPSPLSLGADLDAWAREWLARLTTTVRHPGNLKYAWTLQRRDRRHLPASAPYPKRGPETALEMAA